MLYIADPVIVKNPVKVLLFSNKEIFDSHSYEGRAEADIVAYGVPKSPGWVFYKVVKNRLVDRFLGDEVTLASINTAIRFEEIARFNRELADLATQDKYKDHPYIELEKNATSY